MSDPSISRREVVAGVLAAGVVCTVSGCGSMGSLMKKKEEPPRVTSGIVNIGPKSQYPAGSAHVNYLQQYGIVVVNDSDIVLAIRPKCTHLGCTTKWVAGDMRFECPCHGSQFDILGRPTKGPAHRNLPGVTAALQADGTLTVDLDQLYAKV